MLYSVVVRVLVRLLVANRKIKRKLTMPQKAKKKKNFLFLHIKLQTKTDPLRVQMTLERSIKSANDVREI